VTEKEFQTVMEEARVPGCDTMRYRIELGNGIVMSVQASWGHYCSPRQDMLLSYNEWEIGYPSKVLDTLLPFAENPTMPLSTVYGWVPTNIILDIINENGGTVKIVYDWKSRRTAE